MELIESTKISKLCDYSFGDQAGIIHNLENSFMKSANIDNKEFIDLYYKFINENKSIMTLFIDNIRLYNRPIKSLKKEDAPWVNGLMKTNDLLKLCSVLNEINFIIFTGHEDTPIDEFIFEKIPNNVISIFAVNAEFFNEKVIPFPYGLQRKLSTNDYRLNIMNQSLTEIVIPKKLLYVNHNINTNINERSNINELFLKKNWATVDTSRIDYPFFLNKIKEHKFMICPIGNAIDCHRNWEVLYSKRVPVMKKNKFLEKLFEGFPVLFVNSFSEVTEELLIDNNHLFETIKFFDFSKLDLNIIFKNIIEKYSL